MSLVRSAKRTSSLSSLMSKRSMAFSQMASAESMCGSFVPSHSARYSASTAFRTGMVSRVPSSLSGELLNMASSS